jgi:GNAT superfamily N-acetyltransferase
VTELTLRAATPQDLQLLLALVKELAAYERLEHAVVAHEEGFRAGLFGPRPAAEAMLADCDGAPAGYMLWFTTFSTFLGRPGIWLEDLFVRPALRGRGIGRALLARLAELAVARGCGRMEWAVLDWNEPAHEFYRRLGAAPTPEWTTWRLDGEAFARLGAAR